MQHSLRGELHRSLPKPHHVRMLIIRNKYIHYQKIGSRQVRLSRPDLPDNLEVYIESLDGQGRITYISGYFEFNEAKLKFNAIGMEGYGGPNIGATLSEETLSALRQMGLDHDRIDELVTALQRKIMEGQVHIGLRDPDEPRNPDNKTDLPKS
jgi:hypothetical protein